MEHVDSVLAAVLTFALLGTVVTLLVEMIQRIFITRSGGLKKMLGAYMDQVLWPKLQELMDRTGSVPPAENKQMHKQLASVTEGPLKQKVRDTHLGFMQSFLANRTNVTATQLLDAVSKTELGRHLFVGSEDKVTKRLQSLASEFDEFGNAATEFFKRRAQVISIVVGVALALLANIHGVRIYESFLADPIVRDRLIGQAGDIESKVKAASVPAANAAKTTDVDDLRKDVDKIKSELSSLSGQGVPIGWQYYPNCLQGEGSGDIACKAVRAQRAELCTEDRCATVWSSVQTTAGKDSGLFFKWVFIVAITGVLIGLGGPFWFEIGQMLLSLRKGTASSPTADASAEAKAKAQKDSLADLAARMKSTAGTGGSAPRGKRKTP